ncbi:MAG TPA: hypothetical protein VMK12_16015, partial [Anaeromyxobacteraceae bacterium]|nr:hypothetical protein [Anaeromyxobacteraceae bacterium]
WTDYFLGIVNAAYGEFESRTGMVSGRGSKRALITRFIRSSLSDEFSIAQLRQACPGVSDVYLNKVLGQLKADGAIERIGRGRSARWRRLRQDFQ